MEYAVLGLVVAWLSGYGTGKTWLFIRQIIEKAAR